MNNGLFKDIARNRREYLRKKIVGNSFAIGGTVILAIAVLAAVWAIVSALMAMTTPLYVNGEKISLSEISPLILAWLLIALSASIIVAFFSYLLMHYSKKKVKALVRVPPVPEQIAALPAVAILVRGSDQPAAAPGELLRAAHAGKVDPAAELLRVGSQNSDTQSYSSL